MSIEEVKAAIISELDGFSITALEDILILLRNIKGDQNDGV